MLLFSFWNEASAKGVNVYLPEDSILADRFAADAATQVTASNGSLTDGWASTSGPAALQEFSYVIAQKQDHPLEWPRWVFSRMEAFQKGTAEKVARPLPVRLLRVHTLW